MALAFDYFQKATEEGDTQTGVLPVGQVMGLIHDEPSVAEVIERIVAEAKAQQQKLQEQFL
jgi:NAD(P)H-dependent flavin oxidoreductase YrpB (nitropropane dioxygenase family)